MVVTVDTEKKKEPMSCQRPMLVVLLSRGAPSLYDRMMSWGRGCSDQQALWGGGPLHPKIHTLSEAQSSQSLFHPGLARARSLDPSSQPGGPRGRGRGHGSFTRFGPEPRSGWVWSLRLVDSHPSAPLLPPSC